MHLKDPVLVRGPQEADGVTLLSDAGQRPINLEPFCAIQRQLCNERAKSIAL